MASTPNGRNLFWRYFTRGQQGAPGVWSLQSPSSDNPFVRPEFLESERQMTSPTSFSIEYEAKFLQSTGAVFSQESIDKCTVTEPRHQGTNIVIGIDWAKTRDYSSIAVVSGDNANCSVLFVDRVSDKGWDAQYNWLLPILRQYPTARIFCDKTGLGDSPTDTLSKLVSQPVVGVQFTSQMKIKMVDQLVRLFETSSISIPPNKILIDELNNYYSQPSIHGGMRMEARTGHDDLVAALMLATYHLPMKHQILEGKPR